jgi:hypothetical protein
MATHTPKIESVNARLQQHEAVCEERFSSIVARIKRLEVVVMSTAGTIIILLLSVVYRS